MSVSGLETPKVISQPSPVFSEIKVGVIDYGGGNIRSLIQALEVLGASPQLVTSPEDMADLSHLFFPGQGSFGDCMGKLRNSLEIICLKKR